MARGDSRVVKQSTHNPKMEGSNPANTEREKLAKCSSESLPKALAQW